MSRLDLADGLRLVHSVGGDGEFGHREHLEFAWAVLDEADDLDDAVRLVSLTIRHLATLDGNPHKYHATITIFWLRFLDGLRKANPDVSSVTQMLVLQPDLGDSRLPEQYWSDLAGSETRRGWVEPDLRTLP